LTLGVSILILIYQVIKQLLRDKEIRLAHIKWRTISTYFCLLQHTSPTR